MLALRIGVVQSRLRQVLGKQGEELACRELARRGYAILARRFRTRFGEIDIVAEDHGTMVFVEVKARTTTLFGGAVEAVPVWKQRRIAFIALEYLRRSGRVHRECRFDVVAIDDAGAGRPLIQVIENAFVAGTRW